jgi:hypothetical protein
MKGPTQASRETAEMLAIQALGFLAEDQERLGAFVAATGIAPDAIRAAAGEAGFLRGVLDHMLSDEALLTAFADSAGLDPAAIGKARRALGAVWERDLP